VVKHADAAEVRIVVAAVLTAAADAVLIAQHLQNLVPIWLPHGLLYE
jgi:integral membrane sensor domain MASE1